MAESKCQSIAEEQDEFIRDFNELGDGMLQYECLLGLTADMQPVAPEEKNADTLITGCQAKLWVVTSFQNGRVFVRADSEALIVKGIVAVIVALFDDRTPEEICGAKLDFLERTPIGEQISVDRFRGMQKVMERIRGFAEQKYDNLGNESAIIYGMEVQQFRE